MQLKDSLYRPMQSVLTIAGNSDNSEEDLVLWCVLIVDAERRVGDDNSRVFLYMDAADGHHRLFVLFTLLKDNKIKTSFNICGITTLFLTNKTPASQSRSQTISVKLF